MRTIIRIEPKSAKVDEVDEVDERDEALLTLPFLHVGFA
jgi:hypothetical protein